MTKARTPNLGQALREAARVGQGFLIAGPVVGWMKALGRDGDPVPNPIGSAYIRGEFENKCECPCIKSTSAISKFLTICCLYYGSCEYFGRKVNVMSLSCGSQCKETNHH